MPKNAFIAALLSLLLVSAPAVSSVLDLPLKSLSDKRKTSLLAEDKNLYLLLFFQPNCRWCERQAKVLAELQQHCKALKADAIGIFASYQGLRRSALKSRMPLSAYQSSPDLLRALPKVVATPVMFLLDKQGRLISPFYGFINAEKLQTLFSRQPLSQHC